MKCQICNTDLSGNVSFCGNCGTFINIEPAPSSSTQGGVDFESAIKLGFQRYFDFKGRSSRTEFCWWTLFIFTTQIILWIAESLGTLGIGLGIGFAFGILRVLFLLGTIIPSVSLSVRRLHDINQSGWWSLIWFVLWFIPLLGWIALIVWACQPSHVQPNKYGTPP